MYLFMQIESFKKLIQYEIKKSLKNLNIIKQSNFQITTNIKNVKYKRPRFSSQKCISMNKTYSIGIYLPFTMKYKKKTLFKYDLLKTQNNLT